MALSYDRPISYAAVLAVCLGCGGGGGITGSGGKATPSPQFTNGSFESPVLASGTWKEDLPGTGWTSTGPVDKNGVTGFGVANGSGSWGSVAESGRQYAFLQSSASVDAHHAGCSQTISNIKIGASYKVTFWMARRNGDVGGNVPEPVGLTANGTAIFTPTAPPNDTVWHSYASAVFVATATTYTFVFSTEPPKGGQDASSLLDNIQLVPL